MRLVSMVAGVLVALVPALAVAQQPAKSVSFRRDIAPILAEHCLECHRGKDAEAGVRLDLRADILGESTGHPLVIAGDSKSSRLIARVTHSDARKRMPPTGKPLSDNAVSLLKRWIEAGVAWDDTLYPPEKITSDHWAFQPVERPRVPKDGDHPIDAFVVEKHRTAKVTFAQAADRRTLLRRLSLDLLGLPPTIEEVEAFELDSRPDAYAQWIDRLLESPHYGERWGRHWLDLARWAESEGYESNHVRATAWRYRDYVVESFRRDRPFDEFLTQQIAGDELPDYRDENLIATGFLAGARISSNEEDRWIQRNDINVDIVNMLGSAVLGMTLHCAQCHNHKFDALTARDYYQMQAFFLRGQPGTLRLREPQHCKEYDAKRPADHDAMLAQKESLLELGRTRYVAMALARFTDVERAALAIPLGQRSAEQELIARKAALHFERTAPSYEKHIPEPDKTTYEELKKRLADLDAKLPAIPSTFGYYSPVQSPHRVQVLPPLGFFPLRFDPDFFARVQPYVMVRGDVHNIGSDVQPGFPGVLAAAESKRELRRTDLARWLTDRKNPLVARVWVNRVWHFHFGRGLVATPDDFGVKGSPPSHPQLLDWLAAELMDHGWSTKHLHRLILTSRTYRQAARPASPADPDNVLLTRFVPRRLEAEVLRDAMLRVTGELDLTVGGTSVPEKQFDESLRRTMYLFQKRGRAPEVQSLFDGPNECSASVGSRFVSTSPLQSLYLLNSKFSWERATRLAKTLRESAKDDASQQTIQAFRLVLQRVPTGAERQAAERLLAANEERGLTLLCQTLMNLNEFAYLD